MSIFDIISIVPKTNIGGLEVSASLEESHIDRRQITEHPVEHGANIADNAIDLPQIIYLRCAWSNSGWNALLGTGAKGDISSGVSGKNYCDDIYSQLLALKKQGRLDVTTSKRRYKDMEIILLSVGSDAETSQALYIDVQMQQVIIAFTQKTSLPPRGQQKNAAATGQTDNKGWQQSLNPIQVK